MFYFDMKTNNLHSYSVKLQQKLKVKVNLAIIITEKENITDYRCHKDVKSLQESSYLMGKKTQLKFKGT